MSILSSPFAANYSIIIVIMNYVCDVECHCFLFFLSEINSTLPLAQMPTVKWNEFTSRTDACKKNSASSTTLSE